MLIMVKMNVRIEYWCFSIVCEISNLLKKTNVKIGRDRDMEYLKDIPYLLIRVPALPAEAGSKLSYIFFDLR
jgi:hypothetical protein